MLDICLININYRAIPAVGVRRKCHRSRRGYDQAAQDDRISISGYDNKLDKLLHWAVFRRECAEVVCCSSLKTNR